MAHNAAQLLTLVVRDADQAGLPGDTVYSIGFWKEPEVAGPFETPQFHARLKLTLDEIRQACVVAK